MSEIYLSYDVAPGSDITTCIKIDKPLVYYIFRNNKQIQRIYVPRHYCTLKND